MKENLNYSSSKNNSQHESADQNSEKEYNPFEINLPSFSLESEEFFSKYSMSSNFYDGFPELNDPSKEHCELNEDLEDNHIKHNENLKSDFKVENNSQNFDFINNSLKKNSIFDNSYMINLSNFLSTNFNNQFSEITKYKNDKLNQEKIDEQKREEINLDDISFFENNENELILKRDKYEKEEEVDSLNMLKDVNLKFDESNEIKNSDNNLKENNINNLEGSNENKKKEKNLDINEKIKDKNINSRKKLEKAIFKIEKESKSSKYNLCNIIRKRDKDKIWIINKETRFKYKKDEIDLNIKNNDKFDVNIKDIVILLNSDTSLINQITNYSKKFNIQHYYSNSNEIKTKKELIKRKRDIILEKLRTVKKLGDIERSLYREFKDYLKKNRKKFHLYDEFFGKIFLKKRVKQGKN